MVNGKTELVKNLIDNAAFDLSQLDTSDEEDDEIIDDLVDDLAICVSFRYSNQTNVPKCKNWFEETLPNLDENRFRMLLRCSREQFGHILTLISDNPVFHGKNSEKQFSVTLQLALVMYRLGSNGNGSTIGKIASLFGIGDGGTIDRITKRVFQCILSMENDVIKWPSAAERIQFVNETFEELPYCVGYLDGTEIPLEDTPKLDPTSYYSRNKEYSVKLQAVCDRNLEIRHIVVGWPGSVHDARIYNNCNLSINPKDFFSEMEWLAADSAYKLTTTVITPFRTNNNTFTPAKRFAYNRLFSSYRVNIEHCFGILKEIFPCLKGLRLHIRDVASHKLACDWIRVCCILYNILLPKFDEENFETLRRERCRNQYGASDGNESEDEYDEDDDIGESKRRALCVELLKRMNSTA